MAIIGFHINHLTERSGAAAQRVTQYLTREGAYAPVEVGYLLRTREDTVERGDFVAKVHGNLPAWAEEDPEKFFVAAEAYERGGSQRAGRWATTWQIALPRELTREEQWTMGTAFVETHLRQHAYLCVMHDPVKEGAHQPHLHILFSERMQASQTQDPATYFRRPEVGGAAKDRFFNQRSSAYALREAWADWTNYTLERAGHAARVHPRSLYARDIDRKPEPKVGYSTDPEVHARRNTIRGQRNHAKEQTMAAQGWEARQARLGLTHVRAIEPARFLQMTYQQARGYAPGQWDQTWAREQAQRQQTWAVRDEAQLRQVHQQLTREGARLERHHADLTRPLSLREVSTVLANGRLLGVDSLLRSPQREHGRGRPSRGRVFDEERRGRREPEYDRG